MNENILAFFAHPDDETMLCGGTLALLAREGANVHFLSATRGEGGEMGEPPVSVRERLGEARSHELTCAVEALGGRSLTFLDYADPLVGPDDELYPFTDDFETLVAQVKARLLDTQSGALITHGSNGEYGHPAHLLVHRAALAAARAIPGIALYTVQACFEGHPKPRLANQDDPADLVLDVRPLLPQKTQAALCHRSQHALFVRRTSARLGHTVEVPDVIVDIESLHRVHLNGSPQSPDELLEMLRKTGLAIA